MPIKYGISRRSDGSMKHLGEDGKNSENRERFFRAIGLSADNAVLAGLEHSARVVVVDESFGGMVIDGVDALITDRPEVILAVTVADCIPLYLYSEELKIISLSHISWMGLDKGIVSALAKTIKDSYKISLRGFKALIGPHIKDCCYEIREDVASRFRDYEKALVKRRGRIFLSLENVVSTQLEEAGLKAANISVSPDCTKCRHEDYFSYRYDRLDPVNAQIAYIYIDK